MSTTKSTCPDIESVDSSSSPIICIELQLCTRFLRFSGQEKLPKSQKCIVWSLSLSVDCGYEDGFYCIVVSWSSSSYEKDKIMKKKKIRGIRNRKVELKMGVGVKVSRSA